MLSGTGLSGYNNDERWLKFLAGDKYVIKYRKYKALFFILHFRKAEA